MTREILTLTLIFVLGVAVPSARANIMFTLTEGAGGVANINIDASGTTTATLDWFLSIGDVADSFLPAEAGGNTGLAPTPALSLGGCTASNNFYRDDSTNSADNGVESLLGFFFGIQCLDGLLDLSDLNGNYVLPESSFSDFVPGTYTGLVSTTSDRALQNLGEISLTVVGAESDVDTTVPEPTTIALLTLGVVGVGLGSKRRRKA